MASRRRPRPLQEAVTGWTQLVGDGLSHPLQVACAVWGGPTQNKDDIMWIIGVMRTVGQARLFEP